MRCTCTVIGIPKCVDYTCPANAHCEPEDGVEQCACDSGFIGDGITCVPDPCGTRNCNLGTCVSVEMVTVCVCPPGYSGVDCELPLSSCYSYGDPHFRTFDGQFYDYQGGCKYTMVSTPLDALPGSEQFEIFQINEKLPPDNTVSTTVSISAVFPAIAPSMEIYIDSNGVVTDNADIIHTLPWAFHPTIFIETNGIVVFIKTTFGLEVEWHFLEQVVKISLTDAYQGSVQGLCGNFNGNVVDDITPVTPGLNPANAFGNGWVDSNFVCAVTALEPLVTPPPVPCPAGAGNPLTVEASNRCNIIVSGTLLSCALSSTTFAAVNCRFDVCAKQGSPRSECSSFAFAAHSCEDGRMDSGFWRQGRCEVSCPGISTYSFSASACPRTCFDFLNNDDSPCLEANREACVCPDGYLWSGDECVLPENCGCIQSGQYFKINEVLYNGLCQERCVCTGPDQGFVCSPSQCDPNAACVTGANGRLQCVCGPGYAGNGISCTFDSTCPGGCGLGTCGNQNGRPGCICPEPFYGPTCALTRASCRAFGDPHYITFDGLRYDFQGECSYIAITTSLDPPFTVTQRNQAVGSTGASTTETIFIQINPNEPNEELISLNPGRVVMVDGNVVEPPFAGLMYDIVDSGGRVRFIADFGLEVEWNGIADVTYYLDDRYRNSGDRVQGLCGNFNGNPNDDLRANQGVPIFDAAVSYANRPFDLEICEGTRDTNPCAVGATFGTDAERICGIILSDGPFNNCRQEMSADDVQFFYDSCVYDTCVALQENDFPTICAILSAFARRCQGLGAIVNDWRASLDPSVSCDPQCPSGSTFSSCTSTCPITCEDVIQENNNVMPMPRCQAPCEEGCECAEGLVWQGGICIPSAQCGCFDAPTNQFYTPGRVFLRPGCQEECTCTPGGTIECTMSVNCHCEAVCQQVGGTYECVCPPPFIGDGIICSVDPCMLDGRPCTFPAVCQPVAQGGTICECPPGQFGDDCAFGSSMCFAVGGEFYVTYDGQTDLFYGSQCTYTLTETCNQARADAFSVQITLGDDLGIPFTAGNEISGIAVSSRSQIVVVTRIGPPPSFSINGEEFDVVVLGDLDIIAWRLLDRVIVFLKDGVIISFTQGTVSVTTSAAYQNELCGICGDYDGNIFDTFQFTELSGVCTADDNSLLPCSSASLDATAVNTIQAQCQEIALAYPGCQITNLQNLCAATGCANYPDVSAICSFVDVANSHCGTPVQDITNFAFCRQNCGPFAQFSNSISGCERTCSSPFPLPFCPVPSMSGCQCAPGRILNDVGACVLPAQCGCLQLGVYYEPGEVYYTPGCDQRCTCQLGGFPSCVITNGCPTLATCESPLPSTFTCQCIDGYRLENFEFCVVDPCVNGPCMNGGSCSPLPTGGFECLCLPGFGGVFCEEVFDECKIYGNTLIETFDGLRYHFIGGGDSCEYELASGTSCFGDTGTTTVQNFRLTGSFQRGVSPTTAVLSGIAFSAAGYPEIRINEDGLLLLNGVQVYAPVTINDLLITSVYDTYILRFDFGLTIIWREGYVFIYLNTDYRLNTCGLCGNFDGIPTNDARRSGTQDIDTPTNFANSFLVAGSCFGVAPSTGGDLCLGSTTDTVNQAEALCAALRDPSGPFGECVAANPLKAQSFYTACRNDLCESLTIRRTLCSTYEAFAHWCRNGGYPVRDWRAQLDAVDPNSTPCPFDCPIRSTYTNQMISCPPSCGLDPDIDRNRDCWVGFLEGCRCDPGLVLENDRCIQPQSCGCLNGNSYLPVGRSILNSFCTQTITCPPLNNGVTVIEPFTCPVGGVCIIDSFQQVCQCDVNTILFNGQCVDNPCLPDPCSGNGRCVIDDLAIGDFSCVCTPQFTGSNCNFAARQCSVYGDPNFITFDGEDFEFLAPDCTYRLVSNGAGIAGGASIDITTTDSNFAPLTRVNRVIITEPGVNIEFGLDNKMDVEVCVDGERRIPPVSITNAGIGVLPSVIYGSGAEGYVTYVSAVLGYEVRVSAIGTVHVKYPLLGNILDGLCGNADGVQSLPTNNQATVNNFGDAQRVGVCTEPFTTGPFRNCVLPVGENVCDLLIDSDSPLSNCFATVPPGVFRGDCEKDFCESGQVALFGCAVISAYAQLCRDNGISVGNWRLNTDCAITCPPDSFFDANAPANPPTCAQPNPPPSPFPLPDVESCACDVGFLLEGTDCIPQASCGCMFNGVYFRRNEMYFSEDCSTSCVCPATGTFDSAIHCTTGITCDANAMCTTQNKVRSCVCNAGFSGDGRTCFLPGCENSPCQNGGVCETRPQPGQPLNPTFFCACPTGFIGIDCSIPVPFDLREQLLVRGGGLFQSPSYPNQYISNDGLFRQFYCPGATFLTISFSRFVVETDNDILLMGIGFPSADLDNLLTARPLPSGIELLTGVKVFSDFILATDAVYFYFITNDDYELNGFDFTVTCSSSNIPAGVVGSCFAGTSFIPNGQATFITQCETCVCDNGELGCTIIDRGTYNNGIQQNNEPVRGETCVSDLDCVPQSGLVVGSRCVLPTCLGGPCPAVQARVCSSGDTLSDCEVDPFCQAVQLRIEPEVAQSVTLEQLCMNFAAAVNVFQCFTFECKPVRELQGRKRATDDSIVVEIHIGTRSNVKSNKQMESELREFKHRLTNEWETLLADLPYNVVELRFVDGETGIEEPGVNKIPSGNSSQTVVTDSETGTPWTYLLAVVTIVLLLVAVSLTVTIVSYYRRQKKSFNAKFNPAEPSYPTDNLPETLEMVRAKDERNTFATKIPLDDSTGNRDNVFAIGWHSENQTDENKSWSKKTQSDC